MQWLRGLADRRRSRQAHGLEALHTQYGERCPKGLRIPLFLSDFSLLRAIGSGYAAIVFQAIHRPSGIECVVKIAMKARLLPEEEHRLSREILIHSHLLHPYILTFYAAFEDASAFYLVLEYAPSGDLYSRLRHRRRDSAPLGEAAIVHDIIAPLLNALAYMHRQNIIHRDLKPENILLMPDESIRLCDFGMSINTQRERPRSNVGTFEYMAPEIMERQSDTYTTKIDIWAIGVMAFECIHGRSPFFDSTEEGIVGRIMRLDYHPREDCSADALDFFKSTLVLDPAERMTADELLRHPWIRQHAPDMPLYELVRPNSAPPLLGMPMDEPN